MNDVQREAKHQEYLRGRQLIEEDRINRAERTLEKHEYTCLIDTDKVEVWRCQQPGTTCYAFDIMMTRFGIAVVGDIDNLTWTVGHSYGMKFLAGKDVTYYMHTKLDQVHKKIEFNESKFKQAITNNMCKVIVEHATSEEIADDDFPPFILQGNDDELVGTSCFDALKEYVHSQSSTYGDAWDTRFDLLREADNISDVTEAQIFMRDNEEALGIGPEWYEISVSSVSEPLINELYLINAAAKKIMAIKEQEVAVVAPT